MHIKAVADVSRRSRRVLEVLLPGDRLVAWETGFPGVSRKLWL